MPNDIENAERTALANKLPKMADLRLVESWNSNIDKNGKDPAKAMTSAQLHKKPIEMSLKF